MTGVIEIDEVVGGVGEEGVPLHRAGPLRHLESRQTPFGEKYWITPDSVDKHIAYIDGVTPLSH